MESGSAWTFAPKFSESTSIRCFSADDHSKLGSKTGLDRTTHKQSFRSDIPLSNATDVLSLNCH